MDKDLKIKIAIINGIFFPAPGGAQIQTHNFANKFVQHGHKVDSYIYNPTDIKVNNYNIIIINKFLTSLVYFFEYYLNLNISFILKIYLKRIIKKKKYDVWHFNFINFKSLILINCLKKLKQKIIVTFQGVDIQIDEKINYGYRLNEKYNTFLLQAVKNVDLFLSISKTIEDDLIKIGIKKNKIFHLPNTIEINKFKEINSSQNKSIDKKMELITVARFAEKKKGYDLIPIVAQKLLENNIYFRWTIVGENTKKLFNNNFILQNKKLFRIIENISNIDEKYYPHSRLIEKYVNSDLYVNLARIESFGITFVEAMASGLPVISFNSKGANEIIIDNHNGYIIYSNNIDDLVKKIINLSINKKEINILKANAYNSVEKYDLNLVTKKLLHIYKNINKQYQEKSNN
jgi:glycosyltransferase involved in cell wall biosynthesis